jgi:hypothetical protein
MEDKTIDDVRGRFGELVVAYFMRAIDSLNSLPRGPELAVRRVWSATPADLSAGPQLRRRAGQH